MFKTKLLALSFIGCTLIGCATREPRTINDVTNEMVGMSLNEIATCMGDPAEKVVKSEAENWSYKYDACTVTLEVVSRHVKSAHYSIAQNPDHKNSDLSDTQQCVKVPSVSSCVRWLRNPKVFNAPAGDRSP